MAGLSMAGHGRPGPRGRLADLLPAPSRPGRRPDAGRLDLVIGATVVGACLLGLGFGPTAVVLLAVVGAGSWLGWHAHRRHQERRRRIGQLPEALERMATALRAGSSLPQALAAAGAATAAPLGPELAELAVEAERGRPFVSVLGRWAASHDDRATRLAVTALALAAGVGATPGRALDGVAATLRERQELAGERRALATQARASAAVLSATPIGFALLLGATDPAAAHFIVGTPAGWLCVAAGIALDAVGALWMAHLIRSGQE